MTLHADSYHTSFFCYVLSYYSIQPSSVDYTSLSDYTGATFMGTPASVGLEPVLVYVRLHIGK